jgi:hypothetical protein
MAALRSQLLEMQNNLLLTQNPVQNSNAPRPQLLQRIDYMLQKIQIVLDRKEKEIERHKTPKLNPAMQNDAEAISKAQQKEDEKRRRAEAKRQQEEEEEAQELERVIAELKKQEQIVKEMEIEDAKIIELDEAIAALQEPLNETRETITVTEKMLQEIHLWIAQKGAAQDVQQATVVASLAPTPTPDIVSTPDPIPAPDPTPTTPSPVSEHSDLKDLKKEVDILDSRLQTLRESELDIESKQSGLKTQSDSSKERLSELTDARAKSVKALEGTSSRVVERAAIQAGMPLTPTLKPTHGKSQAEKDLENQRNGAPTLTPGFRKG